MKYNKNAEKDLNILEKGAFLTTEYAGEVNTMTIAWGAIGNIWGRPAFIAMVRKTRYTHELLEKSGEFTVTIPHEDLAKELAFCGTKSGRDCDKIETLGLKLIPGVKTNTPIIDCKGTHYECMVLYKNDMLPRNLDQLVKEAYYKDNDYHTIYFAEIVNLIEK